MHIYEQKSFTAAQEKILRDSASDSYYQEDFLSPEEFELCRELTLSVTQWPEHGKTSKYWGFGLDNGLGPKLGWLLDKVKTIIPNAQLDFFAVQEAIIPWKVHADIRWYPDKIPYKVVLLPMDVEPESGPVPPQQWPSTASISFHQRNFLSHWSETATASQGNNDQSHWARPVENPRVEGCRPGFHVTKELWEKYFTHMPYEFLEGLTIDQINVWKPGSIMFWDNTALHCADDFVSKKIKTKRSLMLFMQYHADNT